MVNYYITYILNILTENIMYVNYVQLIQVSNIHNAYKTYTIYDIKVLNSCIFLWYHLLSCNVVYYNVLLLWRGWFTTCIRTEISYFYQMFLDQADSTNSSTGRVWLDTDTPEE